MVATGAVMAAEPPFIHSGFVAPLCLAADLIFHEHAFQTEETFLESDRFIPRNWSTGV